jgi:hypothetical protein
MIARKLAKKATHVPSKAVSWSVCLAVVHKNQLLELEDTSGRKLVNEAMASGYVIGRGT